MDEIWKDIKGYEGLYEISNIGRVKSLKRKGCLNDRILKSGIVSKGYYSVVLSKNKNRKAWYVHTLVAIMFLNHIPAGRKTMIDHKDNNKLNNNHSNLQITTNRINTSKDRFRHNYTSKYIGVYWVKDCERWRASIWVIDKRIHLGDFINEFEAAKAYQKKLREISVLF